MKKFRALIILMILYVELFSQTTGWTSKLINPKVFIENKGQFDEKIENQFGNILFGANCDGLDLFFTANSLVYRYNEKIYLTEKELEATRKQELNGNKNDEEHEKKWKFVPHYFSIEWLSANTNVRIVGQDTVSFYYTYANTTDKSKAFKKITYKNLYPNIDVEYVFPLDSIGIKYSIILHPGANPDDIKMKYNSASSVYLDEEKNAIIKSTFGEFVDHKPHSFYEDNNQKINSSFKCKQDLITFSLPDYNHFKTVIIDPWTVNPNFPNMNKALKIDNDTIGNIYVYGNGGINQDFYLQKYSPSGALLWIFQPTNFFTNWMGDLAVDRVGGSYITDVQNISKIAANGAQLWSYYDNVIEELFCLEFNNTYTTLVGAGSLSSPKIFSLDMTNGHRLATTASNYFAANEIRGICLAPNNNWYGATQGGSQGLSGTQPSIVGFDNNLNDILHVPSCHAEIDFDYYTQPDYFVGDPANQPGASNLTGENCITATCNFIYSFEGKNLCKYDINTGAVISSIVVTGGLVGGNSGIQSDSCGNIYVGTQNGISKYDSNLGFIKSVTTPGAVYDLAFAPNRGMYAGGNGFVCLVDTIVAATINNSIVLNQTPASSCAICDGTASASVVSCGNPSDYVYLWNTSPPQTGQTITGLCPGKYIINVSTSCETYVDSIVVGGILSSITSSTNVTCTQAGTASVIASGGITPYNYLWSNGETTASIVNLVAGTYTVTVTDAGGCINTQTASVAGYIPSPFATATAQPEVILTIGDSTQLAATGGGTYNWYPSQGLSCTTCVNPISIPAQTTEYCVVVTDTIGCIDSACVIVTVEEPSSAYIPNAFTPNNNNLNDAFKPILFNVHDYDFSVYDRWGEKIFQTFTQEDGWNGYYKGKLCEQGIYVYKVVFKDDAKNNFHQFVGKVTLLK